MVMHLPPGLINGLYIMKGGRQYASPLPSNQIYKGSLVLISLAPVTEPSPHYLAGTSAQGSPLPGSLP